MHARGAVDRYSPKGVSSHFFYDAPLYIKTNELRSLSDIKRIIELMERVKCVRNETLSDLCHAINPSGTINSEQGVNTIRAIQRAIMRLVDE